MASVVPHRRLDKWLVLGIQEAFNGIQKVFSGQKQGSVNQPKNTPLPNLPFSLLPPSHPLPLPNPAISQHTQTNTRTSSPRPRCPAATNLFVVASWVRRSWSPSARNRDARTPSSKDISSTNKTPEPQWRRTRSWSERCADDGPFQERSPAGVPQESGKCFFKNWDDVSMSSL